MKLAPLVRDANGNLRSYFRPFNKPDGVSNLFLLSAQRACYDRPYRWFWHYSKYKREFSSFQDEDPIELGKWLSHVMNLLNAQVMVRYCSETEVKLQRQLQELIAKNDFIFSKWTDRIMKDAIQRKRYLKNPFLDTVEFLCTAVSKSHPLLFARKAMAQIFGLAIPSDKAILRIFKIAPKILECGYGCNGYWSYMLNQVGCDVKVLSVGKPLLQEAVEWLPIKPIIDIRQGDYLSKNGENEKDRALLYVWPFDTEVSSNLNWDEKSYKAINKNFEEMKYWKGDTVIYVGPEINDTIVDPGLKFFPNENEKYKWVLDETIEIPTWAGLSDKVRIFKKYAA